MFNKGLLSTIIIINSICTMRCCGMDFQNNIVTQNNFVASIINKKIYNNTDIMSNKNSINIQDINN